jgi:hypothetical protein
MRIVHVACVLHTVDWTTKNCLAAYRHRSISGTPTTSNERTFDTVIQDIGKLVCSAKARKSRAQHAVIPEQLGHSYLILYLAQPERAGIPRRCIRL